MYINLWVYVLQGIVPGHDPPHVRVEDLEVQQLGLAGMLAHHLSLPAKPSVCHCYWKGGAAPSTPAKTKLAASCWFLKWFLTQNVWYFKPFFLGEKEQRSDPHWTKNHGSVWREANQTMIMGRNL